MQEGEFVGEADATVKIVTLRLSGGRRRRAIPSRILAATFVELAQPDDAPRTGEATFAPDGSEQDALAEYLADNFSASNPFSQADSGRAEDTRLQNLAFRADTVLG